MLSLFLALNLILILNLEPNIEKTMFASSRLGVVKFLYEPLFVTSLIIVPRYLTKVGGSRTCWWVAVAMNGSCLLTSCWAQEAERVRGIESQVGEIFCH